MPVTADGCAVEAKSVPLSFVMDTLAKHLSEGSVAVVLLDCCRVLLGGSAETTSPIPK